MTRSFGRLWFTQGASSRKQPSRLVCWAAGLPPHSLAMIPAVISASGKISCFGIELEFLMFPSPSFQQNSKYKPALLIAIDFSIDCLPKTMFRKGKIEAFHWFKNQCSLLNLCNLFDISFLLFQRSSCQFSSVQFSSVAQPCLTLRPHGQQHARPPCPSPTPGVYSNSCPLSQWCHPIISSSVVPFSSCPQSLPASVSFPMSQLFASGGQSIGVSASASASNEHPGLISFRMDWLDLLAVQGTLKSLLSHHSSKASILRRSALFIVQLCLIIKQSLILFFLLLEFCALAREVCKLCEVALLSWNGW